MVKHAAMTGHRAPYVPGLGLPRPAHRAEGRQGARQEEAGDGPGRLPPGLPRLRREVGGHPARRVQAPRRPRPLGEALPHHGLRLRGPGGPGAGEVRRGRGALQGEEARLLVHPRRHRAGRGRGRVRRAHLAVDLRGGEGHGRPGPAPRGRAGEGPRAGHLDHHPLDPPGEPRHRRRRGLRVPRLRPRRPHGDRGQGAAPRLPRRRRPGRAEAEGRRRGHRGRGGGPGGGAGPPRARPRPPLRRRPGGRDLPAPVHRPGERGLRRRPRHRRGGHRPRPHRPGPRPGGLPARPRRGPRHLQPRRRPRPLRRRPPRGDRLPPGRARLGRQPEDHRPARGEGRAALGQGPLGHPQLPPLLALLQPGHLPGHLPVVHLHGDERPPGEGPRRDRPGQLGPRLGQEPDPGHGREPPGLVHLPAARLGRAHPRPLLRGLRDPPRRRRAHEHASPTPSRRAAPTCGSSGRWKSSSAR